MRRLFLVLASLAAVACGGSSNDNNGGNGLPSGTVGGRAFTAAEARAVMASTSESCSLPNPGGSGTVDFGLTGMKLDFTSFTNVCGDYATAQCKLHANGQSVTIIFARLNPVPPYSPPGLTPGTYQVNSSPAMVSFDGSGNPYASYAQALTSDATCGGLPSAAVQGGTLKIDQVTATQVTGSVTLSFADGSIVQGNFTAPTCSGVSFDICQIATTQQFCTLPPACI